MLILLLGYIISIFNSFFKEDFEYLYDLDSKHVYLIKLNQSPTKDEKVHYLHPFKSPKPSNIIYVELFKENPNAYLKEMIKDFQSMIDESFNITLWNVYYAKNDELYATDLIPEQLSFLNSYTEGDFPNVFTAEAVIIKHSINEILEVVKASKVIIIRGNAASELNNILYGDTLFKS